MRALVGCSGIGGVEIALRKLGFDATGIEIDPAIAEVNRRNGGHCLTADLLDVDPADYAGWALHHFSPPCPSFSVASQGGETETDLDLARKICEFIRIGRPQYFTLENVWGYRKSLSWHLIQYTLLEEGYGLDAWHLNAADYGVPQSRRRMIVIARQDGRQPAKPWPTHSKVGDMFTQPWQGWYGAIEDLIPTLKETQLAPWQRDRWPDELGDYLVMTGNTSRDGIGNKPGRGYLGKEQPANTVSAGPRGGAMPRAVLLGQGSRSEPKAPDQPADTITANGNQTGIKAILVNGGNSNQDVPTIRRSDQPANTVIANSGRSPMRAIIINSQNATRALTIRDQDQPAMTVTTSEGRRPSSIQKVLIVGGQRGAGDAPQTKDANEPIWTICAVNKLDTRICQPGKTVAINPRCLARFQGLPDWFVLPDEMPPDDWIFDEISPRELSCRGIGNALPPPVMTAVLRSII